MENLIVCCLIYVAIVAVAYQPCPTTVTTDPTAPVDYFPEVEPETAIAAPNPKPIIESMPLPVATFKTPKAPAKLPANDLNSLSIRQLKKMASAAKIKRYSGLTKAELIQALA